MATSSPLRHQIIEGLMEPHAEQVVDAAILQWEKLAVQIISIIGESGFDALYTRSIFFAQSKFPWLAVASRPLQSDDRFAGLRTSFEGQAPSHVREVNSLLLITFTDILSSLIGEQLTTRIVRSAWGSDARGRTKMESMEFKNE